MTAPLVKRKLKLPAKPSEVNRVNSVRRHADMPTNRNQNSSLWRRHGTGSSLTLMATRMMASGGTGMEDAVSLLP
jgi:hypothetical protein